MNEQQKQWEADAATVKWACQNYIPCTENYTIAYSAFKAGYVAALSAQSKDAPFNAEEYFDNPENVQRFFGYVKKQTGYDLNELSESKDALREQAVFDDACTIYEKCVKPQGPCDFDGEQFKAEREKYLLQFPSWRGGELPNIESKDAEENGIAPNLKSKLFKMAEEKPQMSMTAAALHLAIHERDQYRGKVKELEAQLQDKDAHVWQLQDKVDQLTAQLQKANEKLHSADLKDAALAVDIRNLTAQLQSAKSEAWVSVDKDSDYDGQYLGYLEVTEECGAVHKRHRIITNRMNKWLLESNERLLCWQPLSTPDKAAYIGQSNTLTEDKKERKEI
jgi:hypothetical protein